MTVRFTVFGTALGAGGLAWRSAPSATAVVVRSLLPERDAERVRATFATDLPGAVEDDPPAEVTSVIERVAALFRGEPVDLSAVPLDLAAVPAFPRRVYEVVLAVPAGRTVTYGEVAARLGEPGAARAVGRALGANRFAPIVPCHRVLAANGGLGGFSAPGGVATKQRLLALERARAEQPGLFEL
ncbi:cysteine methyltransferase [Saccharomonospora piscinae]|uniref:methylated-DNA--[protein]-cysteine S-methyltransferase n=1 Tax=Saccharomonospora piscinae TaxID=687388 RepID=A0A1V8ZZV5_SACPI|nr:MGMT family protein [Saccharomonospora piscinae]OQO90328.1 cysteine methyltransferase [Saccharomonospora piscinae]